MTNLTKRLHLINAANDSDDWKARIYATCRNDIIFWINNFCWAKDPRPDRNKVLPFVCYEFQEQLILGIINHVENGRDLLIEKSRDMGVTWCFLYVFLWYWLFKEGYDFLLGSQSQDDVDSKGNPKAHFVRLRMNIDRIPQWMLPQKWEYPSLRIVNYESNSTITGEANTMNFSRQGRYSAIMFDEFASWSDQGGKSKDIDAWTAAGDASPCRFAISSAKGKNNHFYRLRSGDEGDISVQRIHWRVHPHKDEEWYASESKRRSKAEIAQEVDIDYAASVKTRAAENWNPSIHILHENEFEYDPASPIQLSCDFNIDPMCWSVSQERHGEDITFREYTEETTITETVARKVVHDFKDHEYKTVFLYGDASGKFGSTRSRNSDYDIIRDVFRQAGWTIYMYHNISNPSHSDRLAAANKRLKDFSKDDKAFEFITENCSKLIESIEQTQVKDGGILKDGIEHHFDAWSYRIGYKYPAQLRTVGSSKR